jgi:hypothetical protein
MENTRPLQSISDDELLHSLAALMRDSRRVESELVAHIAEVDGRRLYAREASPSMFAYCTEILHLSGAEAYLRITAARASREHPVILNMLGDGRLHLSGIGKLAPYLTLENADGLLTRAVHKSKRQIEELIAELVPTPDAPAVMRKLPARREQSQPTPGRLPPPRTSGTRAIALDDTRDERGLSLGPPEASALSSLIHSVGLSGPEQRFIQPPARQRLEPTVELRPDGVATAEPVTRLEGAILNRPKQRLEGVGAWPAIPEGLIASPTIPDGKGPIPSSTPALAVVQSPAALAVVQSPAALAVVQSPAALAVAKPLVSASAVQPLSPARYKVQFTASAEFHHKLERLRALMRTTVRDGDLAAIIEEAVTEKLERLEARRFATTKTARKGLSKTDTSPTSRHIPAAVRRAVCERDGSRCCFVDAQGRRCTERHRLEFHHRRPFAFGGDHGPNNIRLMCRAHNRYLAEQDYGKQAMARHRRSSQPGLRG